ncbi:MAG: HlyD family efflux transporter periplasmic adaptor subunit [Bacteroidota bacterium]
MKTKRSWISLGIVAASGVLAVLLVRSRPEPPTQPPPPQTPLVTTVAAQARTGGIEVLGAGTIRARDEAAVAAQVGGRVIYVAPELESGGRVRQGQVLVRLDPADYQNRVAQAQADVASQDVSVLQAEEEAAIAREEYERFEARESRRTPYAGVDPDDYAARVLPPEASGDVPRTPQADPASDARGPSPLTLRQPQLDAARAARQRAQAALDDAELALSRTVIRAPFEGVVRSEAVAVGDVIGVGQPFAQIISSASLEAVVPLSDDEAALVPNLYSGGTRADVYADYGGGRYRWDAVVDRVDATLDEQARTINVLLRIPNPFDGRLVAPDDTGGDRGAEPAIIPTQAPPLLVGSYVDAAIVGADVGRYVAIPRRALRRDGTVWTVEERGDETLLRIVRVSVVQDIDEQVFVAGEIADGASVVTSEVQGVVDGMEVRMASRETERDRTASEIASARGPASGTARTQRGPDSHASR